MATSTINLVVAAENDFLVYEGDTTGAVLIFTATAGGAPISMLGATITMQIRTRLGGTVVDEFSTTSGDIVISGGGNNVLTITGWERLSAGSGALSYVYDLEVNNAGDIKTYLVGKVKVTQDVTE